MRRGQSPTIWIVVAAMIAFAIAALILIIVRPNLVGFGEQSQSTISQAFKGIQDTLSGGSSGSGSDGGGDTDGGTSDGSDSGERPPGGGPPG